jgi:aminopeptidase
MLHRLCKVTFARSICNNIKRAYVKDLILGVYDNRKGLSVSPKVLDVPEQLKTSDLVQLSEWSLGKVRLSYLSQCEYRRVALVGLGKSKEDKGQEVQPKSEFHQNNKIKTEEQFLTKLDEERDFKFSFRRAEKVRDAVKNSVRALCEDDRKRTNEIVLDTMLAGPEYEQQAVEGAFLGTFEFKLPDSAKYSIPNDKPGITIEPLDILDTIAYSRGKIFAEAQIFAATLAETPANLMTPTIFASTIRHKFSTLNNDKVKVEIHDSDWALQKEMNSFLTVAKGSDEEPKIIEVTYKGKSNSDNIDLILVGKGITFDSGGISIKPGAGMKDMKGDMGGAAATMSALHAIVQLGIPLNIVGLAFMCENMPSGRAVKPGDVIRAMNKKSIEIDNTDAEGRLILADALCYASEKKPRIIVDCATLTGAIVIALGNHASGVFTSSNELWQKIEQAGVRTNDYMWRMPLLQDHYMKQLKTQVADLVNVGGREGGSCTAATFLSQFVDFDKVQHWAHIDIAGTSMTKKGMTGRPTRALIELASILSSQ